MIRRLIASSLLATVALAGLSSAASAKTVTLSLNGVIANSTTNTFTFGGRTYNTGNLDLTGLDAFDLEAGDVIDATVTLDHPYVVPGSMEQFFGFSLFTPGRDTVDPTITSGTFSFANSTGPTGLASDTAPGGCGNCASLIAFRNGGAFSFDSLLVHMTLDQLTPSPFRIDSASINYQLSGAVASVPEPATWAMLIAGFGMIGAQLRRRRARTLHVVPATA